MAKKKTADVKEELKNTITPEDVIVDDDSDMPQPETKVYKKYLKCTQKFVSLFEQAVSTLPYNTVLKNEAGKTIRAVDLLKFVEQKSQKIEIEAMNEVISYVAALDIKRARPLMEIIEAKDQQSQLWSLTD